MGKSKNTEQILEKLKRYNETKVKPVVDVFSEQIDVLRPKATSVRHNHHASQETLLKLYNAVSGKSNEEQDKTQLELINNAPEVTELDNNINIHQENPEVLESNISTSKSVQSSQESLLKLSKIVKTHSNQSNIVEAFTNNEINDFFITFAKEILLSNEFLPINTPKRAVYKTVLSYWANGGTDDTLKTMQLILGYNVKYKEIKTVHSLCNCNSYLDKSSNPDTNITCAETYISAMKEFLILMLGDVEFYKDWFFGINQFDSPVVDKYLINRLTLLIDTFLSKNYDLSFSNNMFNCSVDFTKNYTHITNTKTIINYKNVLEYITQECGLIRNVNKIKIYGGDFGKLLPYLRFE